MKHIRQTILCIAIVTIALSFIFKPAYAMNVQPSPTTLQSTMANGFSNYLERIGVSPSTVPSDQMASKYFLQFMNAEPQYQATLSQYDRITHAGTMKAQAVPDLRDMTFGPVISTYTTTIAGTTYRVEYRLGTFADGTNFVKVSFYGPDGLIDPWIYVSVDYLRVQVLWWTVTYGEDDRLYEWFVTNAGGVNEAMIMKANLDNQLSGQLALSALVGFILGVATAVICYGCGAIAGVISGWQADWARTQIDNAYDSNNGLYFQFLDHYLYTQVGSALAEWVYFFFSGSWSRVFPAPGLELFALGESSYAGSVVSSAIHSVGNSWGYNRWAWIGVYRG